MKRVAVIGSGISGVSSAYYLNKLGYDVTLFEAAHYFGGHTNTIDIDLNGKKHPVDTGFLVHNDVTYPNLIHFFDELGIETYPSDMTFSVHRKLDKLYWAGTNIFTVFGQLKNLFRPRFYKFLKEVLRFNKNADDYISLTKSNLKLTLGELLDQYKYSEDFRHWYLLPMGGCIWSTPTNEMLKFPAYTFLRFCMNHGLLQVSNHPKWKTVKNGCRTYVEKALKDIDKKHINEPVRSIENHNDGIKIVTNSFNDVFDYCIATAHPPQILDFQKNLTPEARRILSHFKYQPNKAFLHRDKNLLPENKTIWSAWNYLTSEKDGEESVSVNYLINKLQPVPTKEPVIVSLNPIEDLDTDLLERVINYEHPLFDTGAINSQLKMDDIQGQNNVFYAGAWMRYGFHEDGILNAKIAVNHLLKQDNKDERLDVL